MATDLMRYDLLAQDALRGVIREALRRAAGPDGLPGAHHFYISFRTGGEGVDIDEGLLEKYPEEMTIVLETQFWDLNPQDDYFEVTLRFGGVPKYLKIPYSAVIRFHDPSVGFHLQFDPVNAVANEEADEEAEAVEPTELHPQDAAEDAEAEEAASEEDEPQPVVSNGDGAEVVSLDSFRKK